jgi:chromosome segregation ATPase
MPKDDKKIETIETLTTEMRSGFDKTNKLVGDLASSMAKGFEKVEGDILDLKSDVSGLKTDVFDLKSGVSSLKSDVGGLKVDMIWVKDILEKQTGTLMRLDQERIFSLNYVQRLEKEVEKIKKQLKIA